MNIKLKNGFTQVCVWPACVVVNNKKVSDQSNQDKINKFEQSMFNNFRTRIQYLEEIKTKPDHDEHKLIEGTGGRNDLFFAVHNEDIGQFAVPRLTMGIRWIEEVLASDNYRCQIYPNRVFEYVSWNEEFIKFPKEGEILI